MVEPEKLTTADFIREAIRDDLSSNKFVNGVVTRFPPEPNGYLHIGHSKAIFLNFGIASENANGICNLRFDDTNPTTEDKEYVEAIKRDIRWLGFEWGQREYYASDYYDQLYGYAIELIKLGKAYVDSLSSQEIREFRGTLTQEGTNSPYRNRSVEDNLDLFQRMKDGDFEEGRHVLRAKIDMTSPNMNMRDPTIYRIKKAPHHRTGNRWCIFPMYDFAHGLSDSIEGVTHSLCTMEFEDHRPLYDWFLNQLRVYHPRQIEFARLNLSHTILSKRRLSELVDCNYVDGWDDPRMPTISGLRRRGFTPESIREFCHRIGVAKRENIVELELLEHCVREDLNKRSMRVMVVLRPLRVVIMNYPQDQVEELDAVNNPEDISMGKRKVNFSRVIYIERDDFMENPPRRFYRLSLGAEVRLRYGYFIKCEDVVKDSDTGEILELRCTYDPKTRGGSSPDGRKVRATLHWVSAEHSSEAQVRLYEHLFKSINPAGEAKGNSLGTLLTENSLNVLDGCRMEKSLDSASPGDQYQFERQGYFCVDPDTSDEGLPIFNRTVSLRDTWAKIDRKNQS